MALAEFLAIFVALVVGIFTYFKWAFKYWERRNVPTVEPTIPFGNMQNPVTRTKHIGFYMRQLYMQLKAHGHKHAGMYLFTSPRYVPIDPEFIKNVLQKDFQYFTERGFYYNEKDDPLSANLFTIGGQKWRMLRTKLTPTFTSGKMKTMFSTLLQCGDQMVDAMNTFCQNKGGVDIKEVVSCYTTDVIGSCAFGLDCNSFKSPDAEFRKFGKKLFGSSRGRTARVLTGAFQPKLSRFLGVKLFENDVSEFFMNVVKDTVKYRENNNIDRKDMMKLLIGLRNASDGEGITMNELAAQVVIFFLAGFETSSTLVTFCLYELSRNHEIQQKLRDELNRVISKHDGKITFDALAEMKYMGQVMDETLRKYPPVVLITRDAVMDYKVPGTDVVISKGTGVNIPVTGLHYDPEYYPDPEKFDPDRFTDENKQKRHPFTFLPFGEGPRICIGLRFGIMQTKVGLSLLLKNYKFSMHENTVEPLQMDPFSFILAPKTGIFLNAVKI